MSAMDRRSVAFGLGGVGLAGVAAACSRGGSAQAAPEARRDLYVCEGCEATTERPAAQLTPSLVLAPVGTPGERMRLTGRVVAADGVTPAADVVIYAHHTNAEGLYAEGSRESEWSRRHGRLRGWVRTGADGRYVFDTIKPAPYPDMTMPAHVHLFVLEPGRRPYYVDDVVFDDEHGVDAAYRARQELRGGSGIVRLTGDAAEGWSAVRDIRLERHPD
ncbi:MAG: hypothetical protein J0M36_12515 [Caulobacterales bacterium]|nr:hypothetical protein [Caulobacterales bacterium]